MVPGMYYYIMGKWIIYYKLKGFISNINDSGKVDYHYLWILMYFYTNNFGIHWIFAKTIMYMTISNSTNYVFKYTY